MISYNPIIQTIELSKNQKVDVLRLDLLHPDIPGNKWFKLKYNLEKAKEEGHSTLLTFGGAFSNHIAATAAAGKIAGIQTIGIIRGERQTELNGTLIKAEENGMILKFISREQYKLKLDDHFLSAIKKQFGDFWLVPEGGNNLEGLKGCMEIVAKDWDYDFIFCACGTGTTFAGLAAANIGKVIGINVLKGKNEMVNEINLLLKESGHAIMITGNEELEKEKISNHFVTDHYSFNGYAKHDEELYAFKNQFEKMHQIPLDHLYTNKLFFAVNDLFLKKKLVQDSKILVIHSGGLQSNEAFEKRYKLVSGKS